MSERPRRTATTVVARHCGLPTMVAAVLVVMCTHTLARDPVWRYEWRWAVYQYHFGLLMCGPIACGIAASNGRRWASARWLTSTGVPLRRSLLPVIASALVALAAYVTGIVPVAAIVVASGTYDRPHLADVVTFGPGLAALACYTVAGFAVGSRWPRAVTAPLAAIGAFAVTMAGWLAGAEQFVRLGGAGHSMTTLSPDRGVQIGQVVAYLSLALAAGAWAAEAIGARRGASATRRAALVAALASLGWLLFGGRQVIDRVPPPPPVCVAESGRDYCAPPPYETAIAEVATIVSPAVERIAGIGGAVPDRLVLGRGVGLFDTVPPSPSTVLGELSPLLGTDRCHGAGGRIDGDVGDDLVNLGRWLALVVGDRTQTDGMQLDDTTPSELLSGDPTTQDDWARRALRRVRDTCG